MRKLLTGLWILAFCAAVTLSLVTPAPAQVELTPNLEPFPAFNLQLITNPSTGGKEIRFSTRSWNNGLGPLELVARETSSSGQNVYQRVYNSQGGHQDYFAGTFVWHPSHNHFHFNDYALYQLEPINAPGGSPKSGSKTTFCIMDTNKIDGSLPDAPPRPPCIRRVARWCKGCPSDGRMHPGTSSPVSPSTSAVTRTVTTA